MRAGCATGLIVAAAVAAGPARADWVFAALGRADDGSWRARFHWEGDGGDLDAFPFREACAEVAGFYGRLGTLGGPAPGRIVVVAEIAQGERLRLTRRLARSFDLAGGQCVGEGAGVDL